MFKYLAAFSCALLLITSCKDKFDDDLQPVEPEPVVIPEFKDSIYAASIEAPQVHRVLVEQFTGASCPNCPSARVMLAEKSDANPGRIVVLGIHIFGIPQGAPVHNVHTQDFRTQEGKDVLFNIFGGVSGIPAAGIDRVPVDGASPMNRTFWNRAIDERLNIASNPVNLYLQSTYDESLGKALIKVKAAYTQNVSFSHSLSLVLLEDSLIDAQEYPTYVDTTYIFNDVVRDYITSYKGFEVLPDSTTKTAGTVYQAQFYYPVDTAWKPKNCRLVAYIHRNDETSKDVIQTVVAPLSQ